ncbi:Rieske (2Fe-2S) protein [Paenibacillus allorhizosphaerae]|uniref:3-phenylpropionate/cinnamic acid dioxygenase ferredoxin subunit n=1 Tax=Paenibacillus allorhizosphaerae TaxID=2849866 RepID=A0ABM8VAS3_9BACL|nr:Rieske (2Fe-2S) protein [Paenibacillus allorhizosphaerae]CAG7617187.1 3-phenylpropionate/cinnamic acid dioxygenase ferredoxin subunit [Paenibacillus allorhizosphaerae]
MTTMVKRKVYAAQVSDIVQAGSKLVEIRGIDIGIYYVNGAYYAWRNVCPHAAAPICKGKVCGTKLPSEVYEYEFGKDEEILRCPWHGWEFDLLTGKHMADDKVKLRGYEVLVEGEEIYVLMAQ